MATSGSATFDLEFGEIAEDAFERCGLELRTAYDLRTAKRSLDLLSLEWANRGVRLWLIEQATQALNAGATVASYNLTADTIDLLDHVIRTGTGTNQADYDLDRISQAKYSAITNKNQTGRPLQVWVNRQRAQPTVVLWPIPESTTLYTLVYWRLRRIQDTGSGGSNTADVPARFLPALVAGLAYGISQKRSRDVPADLRAELKAGYDEQFALATEEDRDRVSLRIWPGGLMR